MSKGQELTNKILKSELDRRGGENINRDVGMGNVFVARMGFYRKMAEELHHLRFENALFKKRIAGLNEKIAELKKA